MTHKYVNKRKKNIIYKEKWEMFLIFVTKMS